jgi:S-DNA-T family DNA segregation ATPase FtsK/SpoIIIE
VKDTAVTQPNPTNAKPIAPFAAPLPALTTLADKMPDVPADGSADIAADKPKPIDEAADLSPTFWEDLRDSLPPWLDEFVGLTLILFGILSFVALLFPSGAAVSVAWSQILVQLFGYGSILVAGGIFALGAWLLLPHFGVALHLPPERLLALEIAFLCLLAILHLTGTDGELRALARTGGGGGMLGWGLTALPYWLLGRGLALALAVFILILSIAAMGGVSRAHIIGWLNRTGQKLQSSGLRLVGKKPITTTVTPTVDPLALLLNSQRTPLMRVRPDFDKLPPSLRPGAAPNTPTAAKSTADEELAKHPLFNSTGERNLKLDVNLVGELTEKRDTSGYRLVRRPDGREKRFFDTGQMQEIKKIIKREKTLPDLAALADIALNAPDEEEINRTVVLIENTLLEFDIDIDIVDVQIGPTVTRYAIQPYHATSDGAVDRTRLSKIASYSSDIALALSARRLRLELPVPGTNYMGLEVPNKNPSIVALRSVMESKAFSDLQQKSGSPLLIPLGRDVSGAPVFMDIAKQPHLLIAGTTGSGKSVCIAAMAAALLLNNTPDLVKMIMLDPKMVELSRFNGLPHLLGPVETDTERIIGVLKWCTREMDRRYKLLEEHAVRNIDNYNAKFGARRRGRDYMPHIVIMIDEIGDLMLSRPEETETTITRLAQMARAVGMHLVVATQRPSVDVITGLIKANFPGRIAFSVASGVDSRVILDSVGAETLLGHGDMLYLAPDAMAPRRVQGCYVSDEEVRGIVKHWLEWQKAEEAANRGDELRTSPWERGLTRREFLAETDPMLEDAIEFVVETQEASASLLQRRLGLGYPRAARMVDMLAELGVVGEPVGGGRARRVLIPRGEDPFKRIIDRRMAEQQKKNTSE